MLLKAVRKKKICSLKKGSRDCKGMEVPVCHMFKAYSHHVRYYLFVVVARFVGRECRGAKQLVLPGLGEARQNLPRSSPALRWCLLCSLRRPRRDFFCPHPW
jgi:hypothetical protein